MNSSLISRDLHVPKLLGKQECAQRKQEHLCLCLCVTCLWPSSHVFPFQLRSSWPFCWPVVMHFYIGLARGMEPQIWREISFSFISFVLSPLVIAMQVFGGIILAIAYRGCIFASYLRFDPIWLRVLRCFFSPLSLGLGEHFASFHFISSLRVLWREKCRFSFQPHLREGYLLFREMG